MEYYDQYPGLNYFPGVSDNQARSSIWQSVFLLKNPAPKGKVNSVLFLLFI